MEMHVICPFHHQCVLLSIKVCTKPSQTVVKKSLPTKLPFGWHKKKASLRSKNVFDEGVLNASGPTVPRCFAAKGAADAIHLPSSIEIVVQIFTTYVHAAFSETSAARPPAPSEL